VIGLDGPGSSELEYHSLIVATGATPRTLPGAEELSGSAHPANLDDAKAVRDALTGRHILPGDQVAAASGYCPGTPAQGKVAVVDEPPLG
jgi:NADPH-dependent 2,4-dienoyl-CoA reductase/sulfur reductase-like enzyme